MPLMLQVVALSALVAANSAFAYPHSQPTLYKRGAESLGTLGVVLVATIGSILGVGTCSGLAGAR